MKKYEWKSDCNVNIYTTENKKFHFLNILERFMLIWAIMNSFAYSLQISVDFSVSEEYCELSCLL